MRAGTMDRGFGQKIAIWKRYFICNKYANWGYALLGFYSVSKLVKIHPYGKFFAQAALGKGRVR